MNEPAIAKSSDLPNLDMLRALAVLMVLADHTFEAVAKQSVRITWLGRCGVLFFFVHTACVLMMSLDRHKHREHYLLRDFYVRRLFRIYPLSLVAVAAAWFVRGKALSVGAWLANLALVQNLAGSPDAFGSIWSLPLEVEMYIFLPLIYLMIARAGSLLALIGLWAATVLTATAYVSYSPTLSLVLFAPCFVPGVIAWALIRRCRPSLPAWLWPVFLCLLVAAFEVRPNWTFSSWGACLLLGLAIPLFAQFPVAAVNGATFQLARYSYGTYLGHSILLLWRPPTYRTLGLYLLEVGVIAFLGFHLVESPLMSVGKRVIAQSSLNEKHTIVP